MASCLLEPTRRVLGVADRRPERTRLALAMMSSVPESIEGSTVSNTLPRMAPALVGTACAVYVVAVISAAIRLTLVP